MREMRWYVVHTTSGRGHGEPGPVRLPGPPPGGGGGGRARRWAPQDLARRHRTRRRGGQTHGPGGGRFESEPRARGHFCRARRAGARALPVRTRAGGLRPRDRSRLPSLRHLRLHAAPPMVEALQATHPGPPPAWVRGGARRRQAGLRERAPQLVEAVQVERSPGLSAPPSARAPESHVARSLVPAAAAGLHRPADSRTAEAGGFLTVREADGVQGFPLRVQRAGSSRM